MITKGAEHIRQCNKIDASDRKWCAKCGGHLMTGHPGLKLVDVYSEVLPTLTFEPGVHVNCGGTVLPMTDGLTKSRDFPTDFGGSGETVPE